jgi:hypothetical protein
MAMSRTSLKDWTEILTPWVQIVGLLAAGTFALVEYQARKQDARVERAITYLGRANSEELIEARNAMEKQQQMTTNRLREVLLNRKVSQDERNTTYFSFVVNDLVMHGSKESLETPFRLTLGFLEDGIVCSRQGLCDEAVVRANLADFGRGFIRTYTPYLCYLRHVWNDPSIGKRAEEFYNPTARGHACEMYKASAQRVLEASRISG